MAPALRDDSIHGGQPQPGAFPDFLRREKGLEDPGERLGAHALPRVAHAEHHVLAGLHVRLVLRKRCRKAHVAGPEGESAALRHCIPGVGGKVHEDLLELAGISPDVARPGLENGHKLDVLPDDEGEHLLHAAHDVVRADDARLENLLAAEGQELGREIGRPVDCPLDFPDVLPGPPGLREPFLDEIGVPPHHRHEVVEAVRDSAGEPADRFHPPGLGELLFAATEGGLRPARLGDVPHDAE